MARQLALMEPILEGPDIEEVQRILGFTLLKGETPFPRDFKARAKTREGLAFGAKKTGDIVLPLASKPHKGSEFRIVDAEGAKADDGKRYHAGFDWFSPGGSAVRRRTCCIRRGRPTSSRRRVRSAACFATRRCGSRSGIPLRARWSTAGGCRRRVDMTIRR